MCYPWLLPTECHGHYFSLSSAVFAFLPGGLFKGSEILHGLLTNKDIKILLKQILFGLTKSIKMSNIVKMLHVALTDKNIGV